MSMPGAGHRGAAARGVVGPAGHLLLRGRSGALHGAADAGSKGTRPGKVEVFIGNSGKNLGF